MKWRNRFAAGIAVADVQRVAKWSMRPADARGLGRRTE